MSDRKTRQKELEEKKKKLEEYRKNKGKVPDTSDVAPTSESSSGINLGQISNLDDLLSNLNSVLPPSATPTNNASNISSPASVKEAATISPVINQNIVANRRRPTLTVQMNVSVTDIAPKQVEVYTKGTQTTETYTGELNEQNQQNARSSVTKQHSESSMIVQKQQDDEIHQKETNGENHQQDVGTQSPREEEKIKELTPDERDKVFNSKDFVNFLEHTSKMVERAIYVDSKYDITIDYALTEADDDKAERKRDVTLVGKFFDERWTKHRSITDIAWSQKHNDLVVASYSANEDNSTDPDGVVLIWSLQNTLQRPEYRFHCQSPVMTAFFSPFSPTLVVGGTYSGQIVLWDIRARSTPVQQTPLSSVGHTHPVYCMDVVGTKNAHSLVSISTDGKVCVWSLDNLLQPQEVLELHNKQSKPVTATAPVAVTALQFPEEEVNSFFIGSEEGAVYQAFRHGTKSGVNERFEGHHGPVTAIDFHPSAGNINFSHLLLSSSTDWTCKLWNPKTSTRPLYSFEDATDYIYDVQWCPTHPAVFATADGTGSLDLWNLNEETEVPTIKTSVSNRALSKLVWSHDGKQILTGDSDGCLYLYDTGENSVPHADEWHRFEETINKLSTTQESSSVPPSVI